MGDRCGRYTIIIADGVCEVIVVDGGHVRGLFQGWLLSYGGGRGAGVGYHCVLRITRRWNVMLVLVLGVSSSIGNRPAEPVNETLSSLFLANRFVVWPAGSLTASLRTNALSKLFILIPS